MKKPKPWASRWVRLGSRSATERARRKQAEILQGIGIPTCIGIGPSKTLAKLANQIAKTADRKPGLYPPQLGKVCNLAEMTEHQRDWLFKRAEVGEVWGVGRRFAAQFSADTLRIAGAALEGLKRIFRPGYRYAKAGVMLLDLQPAGLEQQELDLGDDDSHQEQRNERLMAAMDAIQDRFGRASIRVGAAVAPAHRAGASAWQMKQERRSPRYTTDWADLMVVG